MSRIILLILFFTSLMTSANSWSFVVFEDAMHESKDQVELRDKSANGGFASNNKVYIDLRTADYDSNSFSNNSTKTDGTVDIASNFYYNKNWFSYFNFRIEEEGVRSNEFSSLQVEPDFGSSQFLANHYGTIRQLMVGYDSDSFKVALGKFRPKFGYAWTLGRGGYSDYLAHSYMQNNRVGVMGEARYGNSRDGGRYTFGGSLYKYDKKYLDNSILSSYRNVVDSDAVPSSSNSLDSFALNMDIDFDFANQKELFYRFAYSKQEVDHSSMASKFGVRRFSDQEGYSVAMNYKFMLNNNVKFDNLIEYKIGKFQEGVDISKSDDILTVNLVAYINSFLSLGVTHAHRRVSFDGLESESKVSEVVAGYSFAKSKLYDGLQMQIGYANIENKPRGQQSVVSELDLDSLFLLLRYVKNI